MKISQCSSLPPYHCLIVIAEIGKIALFAARTLEDADALAVTQEGFVEVVDAASVVGQQGLQEFVGGVG